MDEITPAEKIEVFAQTGKLDIGYEIAGLARFRANFFNQKYGCAAVCREIPTLVLIAEELGLPPVLIRAAMLKKGLVLVTGPTGSGKSTTLAAMIDHLVFGTLHMERAAKTFHMPLVMQTGKRVGMRTLDDAIQDLLAKKMDQPRGSL